MQAAYSIAWILCLLAASAKPEITSKGKHTRVQEAQQTSVEDADMPRFAEPIANVTVSIGRDALLACVVENLKGYKVAWVRVDTQTILSIHHNVISQNNRISLTYNDHRSWYLHIKEVEENDRGWYMCQVNTDPMRSRKGYLQVVVPPMIVEGMTSNDMVVREGLNVTLMCKARGYPEPYVMWRREDGEEMLIGGEHVNVVDGELLHITKVSRLHMAAYLCVASNGVPPSISKRVHLRVQFPPMLSIPNQLEGAYVGQNVVLECHTEAYPASINYWTTERGDMIISDTSRAGDKYETTSSVSGYTKYMKLKIRSVGPNDFGTYRCVAKNSLGETDGNIKLDEMPAPTTAVISEVAMLNRSIEWRDGDGGNGNTGGDNNQTPERNPPGALHNSAGALAQHNLLGSIIHGIKMQSFGILGRLSSYLAADGAAGAAAGAEGNDGVEEDVDVDDDGTGSNAIIAKTATEAIVLHDDVPHCGGVGHSCCLQSANTMTTETTTTTTTKATKAKTKAIKMATIRCELKKNKSGTSSTTHRDNGIDSAASGLSRDAGGATDMTMLRYDENNHDKRHRYYRDDDDHNHNIMRNNNNKNSHTNNWECVDWLESGAPQQIISNIVASACIENLRTSYMTNRATPKLSLYSISPLPVPPHRLFILCICIAVILAGAHSKHGCVDSSTAASEPHPIIEIIIITVMIIDATFSISQNRLERVNILATVAADAPTVHAYVTMR